MLSLLDDAITIPVVAQGRWRKHFDECTARPDQAPALRRGALAGGGTREPQPLRGQPLNDREEKTCGFATVILAPAAGFSYAIEVELSTDAQTPSGPTIQRTLSLSCPE